MRGFTAAAYQPVFMLQRDAYIYLAYAYRDDLAPSNFRPVAYSILFLKPLLTGDSLLTVAVAQHLVGLLVALALYLVMLRLGVPALLAALGTAPLLLDGYQIAIEHYVLTEAFFQALIVSALVLLAWRSRPGIAAAAGSGLLLGVATLTRFAGAALIAPCVLLLIVRRSGWSRLAALVVAFAVPLALYSFWFNSSFDTVGVTNRNGFFLYGRVASFADCSQVSVPRHLRRFCFTEPPEERGPSRGVFTLDNLGEISAVPNANALLMEFSRRMIVGQPLAYARVVWNDLVNYFEPTPPIEQEPYVKRWRFPLSIADADPRPFVLRHRASAPSRMGYQRFSIDRDLATRLRAYQDHVYTWGPLLALLLFTGLAGAVVGVFRRRDDHLPSAAALFALSGLVLLLVPVATTVYHFRYVIPVLPLAGAAGAIGATALLRRARSDGPVTARAALRDGG